MTRRKPRSEKTERHGHLVVIGGGEDRSGRMDVLRRFVELAGGERARIGVLTAATTEPEANWRQYDEAFRSLGVRKRVELTVKSRAEGNDPATAARVAELDAVYMTGGDQKRLLALIGGTELDFALHEAFTQRGICIGGTSAGASALSEHMLAEGAGEAQPLKGQSHLAAGLGFMPRVIIDQHFSERRRLGRLLSVIAQNPYLLGVGIDEDTALIVERDVGVDVIGSGAVTLVDGTGMTSNFLDVDNDEHLELINVTLHLLPAGGRYRAGDRGLPPALRRPVEILGAVA